MAARPTLAIRCWILTLCAVPLIGCAAITVSSYANRGFEWSGYRTYAWGEPDTFATGDPRLDNNRFFDERVREQVDKGLSARGLEKTTAGAPDVVVHYHVSVTQKIDVRQLDPQSEPCHANDCRPFVYDAGTLFVDLIDPRGNTLVWRGWAEGGLAGSIDNQAWMNERIDDAVMRILQKLPPPGPTRGDR